MGVLDQLASILSRLRGSVRPTTTPELPPAIVEQIRVARGYTAAKPAAEWTDDITRQNEAIAKQFSDEVARRTQLFEEGKYVPRFGKWDQATGVFIPDIEYDVQFTMQRENVTGLQPLQPLLTAPEVKDARQASALRSEVDMIESSRWRDRQLPRLRPTRDEVLAAAGGDPGRAAQVEAKLDELYGPAA